MKLTTRPATKSVALFDRVNTRQRDAPRTRLPPAVWIGNFANFNNELKLRRAIRAFQPFYEHRSE